MYMIALGLTKISIVGFYLRVFPHENFRKICWATIGVCVVYIPAFALATIFHCTPVSYTWEGWRGETEGKCFDFNKFTWAHAVVNIILDIFIMVLPLKKVWQLNMSVKKRAMLVMMFCVGLL